MKEIKIRTAFILGAGLGTRLRPLTEKLPKPLLPVGGRPLITFAMDHCLTIGVERFIVNTHHCAEAYDNAFPGWSRRGIPILFRNEPVLLDTAGGLKNIEDLLEDDETILVYNGDILSDLPLSHLVAAHAAGGREVTLALRSDGPIRNVCLDARGVICDFRDLLGNPGIRRCLFTGIYIVEKSFLRRLAPGRIESVVPVFVEMIREAAGSVRRSGGQA
jgi:mannose-1-phosphate guanylyltransferase